MTKRLVSILGGKGGTGKTLCCRVIYYFKVKLGINVLGFDADVENPEFSEYHEKSEHPVELLDFLERKSAAHLFSQMHDLKPDVVLIDMPGASGRATREQMDAFDLFRTAQELGYRVTIVTVLNNNFNTINSFDVMLDYCGENADYVAIRSLVWAQGGLNFDRWEQSETRKKFQALQGIEIDLPILDASAFDVLHGGERIPETTEGKAEGETEEKSEGESITFTPQRSFFEYQQIPFGDQLLVRAFLSKCAAELEKAASYLGLPEKVAVSTESVPTEAVPETAPIKTKRKTTPKKSSEVANAG